MEKSVMVVGIDDSEHSFYALEWTLQLFFSPSPENSPFKLVIVHAKPSAAMAVGIIGPGTADVVPYVEADLKKIAGRVLERAKEICSAQLVRINSANCFTNLSILRIWKFWQVKDVILEVVEGDPRNVLCETVDKHHASMLVVGSHGYGAIKRAVLGSVSDYCAHHAHCSVMIVKKPKDKN